MISRLVIALTLGLFAASIPASAQTPPNTPGTPSTPDTAPAQSYALVISGLPGPDPYGKWYADWTARFQSYLTKTAHLPDANVTVLTGKDATVDAITAAVGKYAAHAKPQDQLILFLVGHGESNEPAPRIALAKGDLTAPQLAALLNSFPTKNQVVLNFTASSGDSLKTLSAPGRVNFSATSPTELQEPILAEFFLRGLESKRADADKNGTITMLEAFNWAAQATALWISRWQETNTGISEDAAPGTPPGPTVWKASGKETVEIFEKLYTGVPMRQLDPTSDRTAADEPVDIVPPGGQVTADWGMRRVIDEHALLEDCGQGIGVSVVTDKGFQPVLGQKQGDPGYLAAHTVLGQPGPPSP